MRIELTEQNIHIVFDVSEDNTLSLLHFSNYPFEMEIEDRSKRWFPASEIHMSGKN